MKELMTLADALTAELEAYSRKPTKASSARIRKITQQLNNMGPSIRKELVAADKAGY